MPIQSTVPNVICAWCQTVMSNGSAPASHGICSECRERLDEETDDILIRGVIPVTVEGHES